MKLSFHLLFFFLSLGVAKGQTADTANRDIPKTWKKFNLSPRIGIGAQRSFYSELGFSLQKNIYEARHGFMVLTAYTSFEWKPSTQGEKAVYGAKLGYEVINNGGGGGIEIKYQVNDETDDIVITPKLGFGIGLANLFYGYNISTNNYPFPTIRKHQFSLVINTNLIFYHLKHKDE
jgi:hypothetical protein